MYVKRRSLKEESAVKKEWHVLKKNLSYFRITLVSKRGKCYLNSVKCASHNAHYHPNLYFGVF